MTHLQNLKRGLADDTLDLHSKGVLAYLALVAPNQTSYKEQIAEASKSCSATLKRAFSKLENKGYVKRDFGKQNRVWYTYINTSPVQKKQRRVEAV